MTQLLQDLRFALRWFIREPRFTIPAILALGIGIGATSATFSVVRGVILEPLPYRDSDRVVVVWESNTRRNRPRNVIGPANFVAWRERNRSFEYLGMVGPARINLMLGAQPAEVTGFSASADVFPALGVQPALGRAYTPQEDGAGHDMVIVISHELWQTRLGGQPVLGTTIMANGRPRTIVGIMSPGFTMIGQKADFMVPYGWTIERLRSAGGRRLSHGVARLRDGVSFDQATTEMVGIARDREREAPELNTGWSVTLVPVHEQMVDQIRPALWVLSGAVALVLLIACVNVANLLLARSAARQRELGVRVALGAKRGRLIRQMLTESLLLAGLGGAAGLGLAVALHRGLIALVGNRIPIPRLDQVALDLPVLLFTIVLSLATSVIFGFAPALVASHAVSEALHEDGRHGAGPRSRRVLDMLVIAEVALSLVLLAGAGLFIRSFMRLQQIDPGFRAENVLTARVSLPVAGYTDESRRIRFFSDAITSIRTLPGVQSAAGVTFLPLAGPGIGTSFHFADQPEPAPGEAPITEVRPITTQFFRTMGIPHVAGRDFADSDRADSLRVAIVSEGLAQRYRPGENVIGKRIHVMVGNVEGGPYEIVGIVGDIKMSSLDVDTRPAVYIPHPQLPIGGMTFVVRTPADPLSLANSIGAVVRRLDAQLPLADVKSMEDVVDATLSRPRVIAVLLTVFASIALVLAAVGVYGVIAFSVAQRTREIGVRMALGAAPSSVFGLVMGQALRLVIIGVGAGILAAAALTRVMKTLLYETTPLDTLTFATTAVLLVVVGILASYVPARRGTRVMPVEALRVE